MDARGDDSLCPDWIYSNTSNVHVAKDKAWFKTYHPFNSQITSLYNIGAPSPVVGIGTVEFSVKALSESFNTCTIELRNVLHVPSYTCNVLGQPIANVYTIDLGGSIHEGGAPSRGGLFLAGKQVAHFQPGPISFFSLAVLPPADCQFRASPFRGGAAYVVSCQWGECERQRWLAMQATRSTEREEMEPPYTIRELAFVNKEWGTESRFLMQHRLHIFNEKGRSEGRRMVRAYMAGRDPHGSKEHDFEVDGNLGDYENFDGHRSNRPAVFRAPFL
ncbi:hypothetical protein N0V94_002791 [Neodidymelliopsis sp. IMI 364377]|nr:hypothetical protein N0V94_002791 [Neodidymelliopsis sp. IMI 364377]